LNHLYRLLTIFFWVKVVIFGQHEVNTMTDSTTKPTLQASAPVGATGPSVAVVGAGMAGAACAASLQRAGLRVTLFDKSRGVGGRMATRRAQWVDAQGQAQAAEFDHGAQFFSASHPRFRAAMRRAQAAGVVAAWNPLVHAAWPAPLHRAGYVAQPGMPALCRHLLRDLPVHLEHAVQRLQRGPSGWTLVDDQQHTLGPFRHVVLAMPPAQAARLVAGHQDSWADTLAAMPYHACWTLMAVTDEPDWPWDACEPTALTAARLGATAPASPLVWVARNDRKPGRSAPAGLATWVAHASPAWSQAHLEAEPQAVQSALRQALAALLPGGAAAPRVWHHSSVQRWRFASPAPKTPASGADCWWDGRLGLGVCGDYFGGNSVEAAWRSGDELADTLLAWFEQNQPLAHAA
jgi:renalase